MKDWLEDMKRFRREINRLFDTFWTPETGERLGWSAFREPLSDLRETDKELIASIELPGVDKKDIQLHVTENSLEVRVEKKAEATIEKKGYIRAERAYKGFHRLISLPATVIPEKTKASYKDGVLEVVMPKAGGKKSKKIDIE